MKYKSILLLLLLATMSFGQVPEVSVADAIKELQITKKEGNNMKIAIWLPIEYWAISLQDSPDVTPEVLAKIESIFENFILVMAVDININGTSFQPTGKLDAAITDSLGKKHLMLKKKDIPKETNDMLNVLKPVLANMLGSLGENMHLLLFDATDANGDLIADSSKEGKLNLLFNGERFNWDLPLSFLMTPKQCPIDGASMNGKWKYCPYHGNELVE